MGKHFKIQIAKSGGRFCAARKVPLAAGVGPPYPCGAAYGDGKQAASPKQPRNRRGTRSLACFVDTFLALRYDAFKLLIADCCDHIVGGDVELLRDANPTGRNVDRLQKLAAGS